MAETTLSSSSPAVPVQLPEDILTEILKRLPARTLVRLRCVCKSWRRILTDPIFINMHHHLYSDLTTPTRIIFSRYFKTLTSIPLPPNANPNTQELHLPLLDGHTYYVKGHCRGLLCLILNDGTIVVWNPSIGQYKTLPTPSNFKKTREVLGIGYDFTIDDFKIVRVPSSYCKFKVKDYHPQVEVLTLKSSNSWRKLPDRETPPYFMEHYQQSLTLNGAVYWLTLDDFSTLILRFDLSQEKFSRVPPPPDDTGRNMSWLGVLKDSLCVLHSHRRSYFDIWATKDDCNWMKLLTVSKILDPEPCLSSLDYAPLCFIESGALLISVKGKGLVEYDPEEQRYGKFAVMEDARWLQETVYTDSLVFPHGPPLEQTGSSPRGFTRLFSQVFLGFSNAMGRFTCHDSGSKRS